MARGRKSRRLVRRLQRKRKTQRRRRTLKKQRGGVIRVPDDRFPPKSIISVRDSDDEESPFFSMALEDAEKDFIAAADRPQDPYGVN